MHVTAQKLRDLAPTSKAAIRAAIAGPLTMHLPTHGIDTPLRVAAFLAQAAHETAHFRTLAEYGSGDGPDPDQWDDYLTRLYDRRTDLGNTPALDGDGELYKGRGIFQLTGRANYETYGRRLGLDLVRQPALAAGGDVSVRIACLYWNDRQLNPLADAGDMRAITRAINGGLNGLADRLDYYQRACGIDWFK